MSSKKLGGDNPLRQKAVNLFYLIFLILLFSFVQSDFLDSTIHSIKAMEVMTQEYGQLNTDKSINFLRMLPSDEALFEETRQSLIEVETLSKNTLEYINDLKKKIIEVDKFNDYGYYKNGREESTSNMLMISEQRADSLFKKLNGYKQSISKYLSEKEFAYVNELLPLNPYEMNSEGHLIEANNFYFKRAPLYISVLNLTQFASRIERIKIFVSDKIMRQVLEDNAANLPIEGYKFTENENIQDYFGSNTVQDFFEKLDPIKYSKNEELKEPNNRFTQFFIESLNDSVHVVGQPIKFDISFDSSTVKKVLISVQSSKGTEYFSLNKSGKFLYFPNKKGNYNFTFSNDKKKSQKSIIVIDAEPVLENTRLSTLYIGIDNPLSIKTSEFDEEDNLIAEINDGNVIRKGNIFYARVYKKGIVQIKIFVQKPYGKIKVAEKSFVVRELQAPMPSINKFLSGATVSVEDVKKFSDIQIKTDEYLVDELVYVADFDFIAITSTTNKVSVKIKNVGASLNNDIRNALENVQSGDLLIFNNIRTLSSRGTEIVIPNLTLTVN